MAHDTPCLLITGAGGQVGFELSRALSVLGRVVALDRRQCDLGDERSIRNAVSLYRPDVIINAGAWTAVDKAESESEAAFAVNAAAPGVLAQEAEQSGALLVHYSTDYVFDGKKSRAYTEEDMTAPLSVYGRSKLAGEQAVMAATGRHLIFRTSWVYGAYGSNFMKTILRLARERDRMTMVADQVGAPTGAALIADTTAQILARYLQGGREQVFPYGLYHLTAAGEASWLQYARFIVEQAGQMGIPLLLSASAIDPIPGSAYPLPAKRPGNSRLDTDKLQRTFGLVMPHWHDGVRHALRLLA